MADIPPYLRANRADGSLFRTTRSSCTIRVWNRTTRYGPVAWLLALLRVMLGGPYARQCGQPFWDLPMNLDLDPKSHALIAAGCREAVMWIMADKITIGRIEMRLEDLPDQGENVKRFVGAGKLHRDGTPAGYELWVGPHLALFGLFSLHPREGKNDLALETAPMVKGTTATFQLVFRHVPPVQKGK